MFSFQPTRVESVIITDVLQGKGTDVDPYRRLGEVVTFNGELVARYDIQNTHARQEIVNEIDKCAETYIKIKPDTSQKDVAQFTLSLQKIKDLLDNMVF